MPHLENGTIMGQTDVSKLTENLSCNKWNLFQKTYVFYLTGLVLSGHALFDGRRSVVFCFKGNNVAPFRNANLRMLKREFKNRIKSPRRHDEAEGDQRDSDQLDILMTLYLAARCAVEQFQKEMSDPEKQQEFKERRRAENGRYSIRKTLQMKFCNEIYDFCRRGVIRFQENQNVYMLYMPAAGIHNTQLIERIREDGSVDTSEMGKADAQEMLKQMGESGRHYELDEIESERELRDFGDIRRYRISLVREVGDVPCGRNLLSGMECYALYYDLYDRKDFLTWITDDKIRDDYRQTPRWSDQMIADLLQMEPGITETQKEARSRRNVCNYRKLYGGKLIGCLQKKVPDIPKYVAENLVLSEHNRFEDLAALFRNAFASVDKRDPQIRQIIRGFLAKWAGKLDGVKTLKLAETEKKTMPESSRPNLTGKTLGGIPSVFNHVVPQFAKGNKKIGILKWLSSPYCMIMQRYKVTDSVPLVVRYREY